MANVEIAPKKRSGIVARMILALIALFAVIAPTGAQKSDSTARNTVVARRVVCMAALGVMAVMGVTTMVHPVAAASTIDINGSISPLIYGVADLADPLIYFIFKWAPYLIAGAIVAWLVDMFTGGALSGKLFGKK